MPDRGTQKCLSGRPARLACGESIVEARESFPCITVICIKSWVCGQSFIPVALWSDARESQNAVGEERCSNTPSPPSLHSLVFQVGMPLCMVRCWWKCSSPRENARQWWCWFTCWWPNCQCRKIPVKKKRKTIQREGEGFVCGVSYFIFIVILVFGPRSLQRYFFIPRKSH